MSLRRASAAAVAAAAVWCFAGAQAEAEAPPALGEAALPEGDDECLASGDDSEACAVNAIQMRGARLAAAASTTQQPTDLDTPVDMETAVGSGSWHGSCRAYGCHSSHHAEFKCQCNPDCNRYGNCCHDFNAKCSSSAHSSQASCHTYGCNIAFHRERSCQCNANCHQYGNCCQDYYAKCNAKTHHPFPSQEEGSCQKYGCHSDYNAQHSCQCNDDCAGHNSCCHDYQSKCHDTQTVKNVAPSRPVPEPPTKAEEKHYDPGPAQVPSQSSAAPAPSGPYRLDWDASGTNFFSGWDFLWNDDNHGSAEYLLKAEAEKAGVAQAYSTHAILTAGATSKKYLYKRETAKIQSKKSWKHFLLTMKYTHLPFGCGVWPAFFTLGTEREWPTGGEFDVLEYVNMDVSKSSIHMGPGCTLKKSAVNKHGDMPDRNNMNLDCHTDYGQSKLGCAPNAWMHTGETWSNNQGVVALEWTEDHIKIFAIPSWDEGQLTDLASGSPNPKNWDKWLFSYYPLAESGCSSDMFDPQKLLLQINFCGDWASKVWSQDNQCKDKVQNCRAVDPLAEYQPDQDCCTQFIWDKDDKYGTNQYLRDHAFFNITYLKVFTQS